MGTIAWVPMHGARDERERAVRRGARLGLSYVWWRRRSAWAAREPPARATLPSSHPEGTIAWGDHDRVGGPSRGYQCKRSSTEANSTLRF